VEQSPQSSVGTFEQDKQSDGHITHHDTYGDEEEILGPNDNESFFENTGDELLTSISSSAADVKRNPTSEVHLPHDRIENPIEKNKASYAIDAQTEGYIKILCFLDKIQAPIKAFDELMKLFLELHYCGFHFGNYHQK
jgi:hypothetical protein